MNTSTNLATFSDALEKSLQNDLPGLSRQLAMAPPYRDVPSESWVKEQQPKMAAVLITLVWIASGPQLVFTKRRSYVGVHSDQVSFPGGKREPEDTSLLATALRESNEEIGLPLNETRLLGALTPLYIPPSNYLVHPYVASVNGLPTWRIQEEEVAELLTIPLAYLQNDDSRKNRMITVGESSREVPGFVWQQHFIWGATAMILEEFLAVAAAATQA